MTSQNQAPRTRNRLLAALPDEHYGRLLPRFETISLTTKQLLAVEQQPIEHAYFPVDCVISLLAPTGGETFAEVATVGCEGMVGTPILLRTDVMPHRAFCQIPGLCLRMSAQAFRVAITDGGPFVTILHRYIHTLMVQLAQGAACNSRHSVEQRCAKWLLLSRDRVGSNEFPLTQEFLCQMLGVRRATVSDIASSFQEVGLIHYTRGKMMLQNPEGLNRRACDCYRIISSAEKHVADHPASPAGSRP